MPALIETLIDKVDGFEVVRDQIAAILAIETASQQALAHNANPRKDPRPWKLRVFLERAGPWDLFDFKSEQADHSPAVNVFYESDQFDEKAGNAFERQKVSGTFNIDCYGCGVSTETEAGHEPGDLVAAREAHRALRLARNILMSAHYIHLGLRPLVSHRWLQSRTVFQPPQEDNAAQRIVGARLALRVDFTEFAPQHVLETLEQLHVEVRRAENGQVLHTALYDYTENDP
jgi:hypothetical protein